MIDYTSYGDIGEKLPLQQMQIYTGSYYAVMTIYIVVHAYILNSNSCHCYVTFPFSTCYHNDHRPIANMAQSMLMYMYRDPYA